MSAAPIPQRYFPNDCGTMMPMPDGTGECNGWIKASDHAAALAASEARVAELEAGIVHRGDDVIMPEHLYLEINASGAHWKTRAEAAERSLIEARKLADGWIAAAERLEAGSRDFDLPADPAFVLSRENRAGTFRGCAKDLHAAIDALLPKGEGATS